MITLEQKNLIAAAAAEREKNPQSRPTIEQLRAIDALLIEQAKARAVAPPTP